MMTPFSEDVIKSKIQYAHSIIVDHYAISKIWEDRISKLKVKIVVIDDLANREHNCSLLIDHNSFVQIE